MNFRSTLLYAALAMVVAAPTLAGPGVPKENPKAGELTYSGSGSAERAPEFAEVFLDFTVSGLDSAEAVTKALEDASERVWLAIAKKTGSANTETDAAYWAPVGNIAEYEGSMLQIVQPTTGANAQPGKATRIDNRTNKEIPVSEVRPPLYSGSRRIGLKSKDIDFVEGLVRGINELPKSDARGHVHASAQAIRYQVTEATKREMHLEVLTQAREAALGVGSFYAIDRQNFAFESAEYLGHSAGHPSRYQPVVGQAPSKGARPRVTLSLPFSFEFYATAKDLIKAKAKGTGPISSTYEVPGSATVDADYGVITVTIQSGYHAKSAPAAKAVNDAAEKILASLRALQGDREASETDRIVDSEAAAPRLFKPWKAIEWDEEAKPTKYVNTLTGEIVPTPEGGAEKLVGFYTASRSLTLHSSDFAKLGDLQRSLVLTYGKARGKQSDVVIAVTDVQGAVTEATSQKVAKLARASATACVVDPTGPLAADAKVHGFDCAHLKGVTEGSPMAKSMARGAVSFGAAPQLEAMSVGGAADDAMEVTPVTRPNSERPTFAMRSHFDFTVRVISKNLNKGCGHAVRGEAALELGKADAEG